MAWVISLGVIEARFLLEYTDFHKLLRFDSHFPRYYSIQKVWSLEKDNRNVASPSRVRQSYKLVFTLIMIRWMHVSKTQ